MRIVDRIYKKYPFPPLVWFLILETAMARGAFFLAMPFVAIKMYGMPGVTATQIGCVLGLGPLVGTVAGFYVGHLSDLWGRRNIIFWALVLWSLVFLGFSFAHSTIEYAILMIFNGLARAAYEPVSTALISDLCAQKDKTGTLQKGAFHLRYFCINVGAAVAPLIGASLILKHPSWGFQAAAFIYFLSAILFKYFSNRYQMKRFELAQEKANHTFKDVLKVLARDRILQIYLMAFFTLSLSFSQIDSTLTLYLKDLYGDEGISLFAKLLSVNGILVVLFTLPILSWVKRFDLNLSCAVSALMWSMGYFIFGVASEPMHFYLGMLAITFGEIVVFANGYQMIESLAPPRMKGAYMGTTNLGHSGVVVGPVIGGMLLELGGGKLLFTVMGLVTVVVSFLYLQAKKARVKYPRA